MSNSRHLAFSLTAIMASLTLTGCTQYAPGYDGWTSDTVEKVKHNARARFSDLKHEDGKLLGVDYLKFDTAAYQVSVQGSDLKTATQCESPPYVKFRMIGTVALKTSVCLDTQGEVSRLIFDYVGSNHSDVQEVANLAQEELKSRYGSSIPAATEKAFITKGEYHSIYFAPSPSQEALLQYSSLLVSDYITSASADWTYNASHQPRKDVRFVLDMKLRDYSSIQKQAAARRTERLKALLNASE